MTRILTAMRWDVQLQIRNGFYYASAFVAVFLIVVLTQLDHDLKAVLLPPFILENMLIGTFYFIAGQVLLEKREGTLEGLVVTPLRHWEYLSSKLLTLTLLALFESLAFVLIGYGIDFNAPLLIAGITLLGVFYALLGFIAVVRYDSLNSFLMPSIVMTSAFSFPLMGYFELWQGWVMYLHPMQASLMLMKAAFFPTPTWQILYGLLYGSAWIAVAFYWSDRAFYRFVILKEGVKR